MPQDLVCLIYCKKLEESLWIRPAPSFFAFIHTTGLQVTIATFVISLIFCCHTVKEKKFTWRFCHTALMFLLHLDSKFIRTQLLLCDRSPGWKSRVCLSRPTIPPPSSAAIYSRGTEKNPFLDKPWFSLKRLWIDAENSIINK